MPDGMRRIRLRVVQPYTALYRHQKVERHRTAELVVMIDEEAYQKVKTGVKTVTEKREDHVRMYGNPMITDLKSLEVDENGNPR